MKKVKIAQIGVGHNHGEAKMLSVLRSPEFFEMVGYAEPDEEWFQKRGHLKCYDGIPFMSVEELLNVPGLEAVLVEPAVPDLMKIARMCIDRGLHIHLDKPAGYDLGEYRSILRDAKQKNLVVQLGLMYRHNPAVQECIRRAKSGELGEIYYMDCQMSSMCTLNYRNYLSEFPHGNMYIFGCHMHDLILSVMGAPEQVISVCQSTGRNGTDCIDNSISALIYPKGTCLVRISAVEVGAWDRRQLVVCGEKGTIEVNPLEMNTEVPVNMKLTHSIYESGHDKCTSELKNYEFAIADRYLEQVRDFARIIRGEIENPYTWEYEYLSQLVNLAACGVVEYKKPDKDFVL